MKTLTEFPSMTLKSAAKTKQDLIAGGKSPDDLPPAMGEALKLEGDRLGFLLNALEMIGGKLSDLKRVVVYALNEGEKAPEGTVQKGDHIYLVEYYASLAPKNPERESRDDRPGKGKRGGKGGKGQEGRRNERGAGRPQSLSDDNKRSQDRPRPPAGDRPSRPPRIAVESKTPAEKRVIAPKKLEVPEKT